jgi:SAM-dependent methyltransferase
MRANEIGPERVWAMGLVTGFRTLRKEPILGLKRLVLPVGYWRAAEFAYVFRRLRQYAPGSRILDLGSPKDLAAMLARYRGHHVVATDIMPEAVDLSRRYARAQGIDGTGPGRVASEVQDGRDLRYPDDSFDAAYSVSVLEHIPDRGDTMAVWELLRVLKPGGDLVGTVPYAARHYDSFVDHDVYERKHMGSRPIFFERHYDDESLEVRLFAPAGENLIDLELWGEGTVRMEALLQRLGPVRTLLSPAEPLLSIAFLRRVRSGRSDNPMAAFFTLQKPAPGSA